MPHPKELRHVASTQAHGHHVCSVCKGNIRERKGERAVNFEKKWWRDHEGHLHIYYTKAHFRGAGCARVLEGGLSYE